MRSHWWLIGLPAVLLLLDGVQVPRQAAAQSKDREIMGYVVDSSNPGYFVLAGGVSVPVNRRTQYWIQSFGSGRMRRGTLNDVMIERGVRILVGPDSVAKSVIVLGR